MKVRMKKYLKIQVHRICADEIQTFSQHGEYQYSGGDCL